MHTAGRGSRFTRTSELRPAEGTQLPQRLPREEMQELKAAGLKRTSRGLPEVGVSCLRSKSPGPPGFDGTPPREAAQNGASGHKFESKIVHSGLRLFQLSYSLPLIIRV